LSPSNLCLYNTSAKQELFATDTRLLLMYIRIKSLTNTPTNAPPLFFIDASTTFLGHSDLSRSTRYRIILLVTNSNLSLILSRFRDRLLELLYAESHYSVPHSYSGQNFGRSLCSRPELVCCISQSHQV